MRAETVDLGSGHSIGWCRRWLVLSLFVFVAAASVAAQSSTGTLVGTVVDTTGAVLPSVELILTDDATAARRHALSGADGAFVMAGLPPGRYTLAASCAGFRTAEVRQVLLNVNDRVIIEVKLELASRGEGVTVVAEAQRISTSPAVSTVIDRTFVENLPLNGRSFQSLLELTPGVVLVAAGGTGSNLNGQFSVNGQRASANYLTVDGVSANTGVTSGAIPTASQAGSGQLPALNALGGTNGLVSVDALQEFRVQTSTYAPEFGRMPGGQVSMVTRSGTNLFHGSVFEFFRDDSLVEATDWFVNSRGQERPELRQHNAGGAIGGPLVRNQTFFFLSYEGLRLRQPKANSLTVLSVAAREAAIPELKPYLQGIPLPNGRDYTNATGELLASYSDPSRFDATSLRLDHRVNSALGVFGRASYSPSESSTRQYAYRSVVHQNNTSITTGATWLPSARMVHELRLNYTRNGGPFEFVADDFGGATPPPDDVFGPFFRRDQSYMIFSVSGGGQWQFGRGGDILQRQWNIVDSLTFSTASHEMKFGVDFRRIHPILNRNNEPSGSQLLQYDLDLTVRRARAYQIVFVPPGRRAVKFDNLSLFAQDNWKLSSQLTMTYGVRWELVRPPEPSDGPSGLTLENLSDPYGGQMRFAPVGTPLWTTRYNSFAPRIGASYLLSDRTGHQAVVRGGFGVFHDLGYGQAAQSYTSYPFTVNRTQQAPVFPLAPDVRSLPFVDSIAPTSLWVMDRNLEVPYTYQWNVSFERALGTRQRLTVSYVGAEGRKLLKLDRYNNIRLLDWPAATTTVSTNRNRGYSDYRALQFQFQRRLHRGLQAQATYTFGRSRDTSSSDTGSSIPTERLPPEVDYGYSDFDVRHVATAAVTFQVQDFGSGSLVDTLTRNWGLDVIGRMRSGTPLNINVFVPFPPDNLSARPDVVANQPFWIEDSQSPGGRRLNRAAFSVPAANTQGNLPRGVVRSFPARQVDAALRRDFSLTSGVRLQLRFEVFNVFNTPNFGSIDTIVTNSTFGRSSQMLNRSLGGLSALYQIGGPRSSQAAVKLLF